ncbi:DNA-directed RNA polymerase sigma-70 factor [Parapedobacter defluvii]|uniref:DNA-directed RNA polymerase sigma-70 factor n=1 Tax=Parapedobacter defluvii TaxID=2045106 RepID=A0ABQ1L016_9SPHI|nr:RNA polymerase sigma-70 factor [Parapedobacter defluvii]GGC13507.1 DNA-directed RNA polymerase sigma-70 factor [Parapedobacter defluvii]
MSSVKQHTDSELLVLLKENDELAFTELYKRYWKKLFAIAANRLGYPEDAEEIVQDIFASLWRRRITLKDDLDVGVYLSVSVKYRVIKTLGKHYLQKRYIDSLVTRDQIDDSTQEWLAFEELRDQLALSVAQLPRKCRLVFQLSRDKGLSQKQIATELGISEKTVEAHLGKAFKILRTKLASFLMTLL